VPELVTSVGSPTTPTLVTPSGSGMNQNQPSFPWSTDERGAGVLSLVPGGTL
jgi:hypothetical protein